MRTKLLAIATAAALAIAALGACGTDATGVEACRQVESARCHKAFDLACPDVDFTSPVHVDNGAEACVRYYNDACQHGLVTGTDPGGVALKACVDAINGTSDCNVVEHPESTSACAWLIPPAPVVDAGLDAPADAPGEAAADAAGE